MSTTPVMRPRVHDPSRDTALAWLSLLLYPVTFLAAFLVGEGLASWLFGWPETTDPALWQVLVASVPALLVFVLPALLAWHFGMRAHRGGSRTGRVAAWVGVVAAAAFVAQNALAYLVGRLG